MIPAGLGLFGGGDDEEEESDSRPSPEVVYLWVSPNRYSSGDLSGVSGADSICQGESSDRNAPSFPVSTHRAVIASSSFHPRTIFANDPEVKRSNGTTVITDSWSDFFNPHHPLLRQSIQVPDNANPFWSGMKSNGDVDSDHTCSDWASDAADEQGTVAWTNSKDIDRYSEELESCDTPRGILCVSY